jgi:hypothetical protein
MVYRVAPQTVFNINGFWVYDLCGVVALSYTDDQSRALRFLTSQAETWEPIIQSMVNGGFDVVRVDLSPETSPEIVPLSAT